MVVALVLAVGGCRAPTAPVCPTCPTCPAPRADTSNVSPPPADAPPKPDAPREQTDAHGMVPAILTTRLATIVVEVHEATDDDSGDPALHLHMRVAPPGGSSKLLERSSPPNDCAEAQPEVALIGGDEENEVVDVRLVCVIGETIVRELVEHTVVHIAAKGKEVEAEVVFTGLSTTRNNRELAVESDTLELHFEAGALAVYRQRAGWCDRNGLRTLLGPDFAGCASRKRTLTLVKRIPLEHVVGEK